MNLKRIVSLFVSYVFLVLCLGFVSVDAADAHTEVDIKTDTSSDSVDTHFDYYEKLCKQFEYMPLKESINTLEEVYCHTDDTGEIDWTIVHLDYPALIDNVIVDETIGGREVFLPGPEYPFTIRYSIYNVKDDYFYTFIDENANLTDIFDRYDGLYDAWQELDLSDISRERYMTLSGDANGDRTVDIRDATHIQRYLAALIRDEDIVLTTADVDRDGYISVMDATRIQRALAGICTLDGQLY